MQAATAVGSANDTAVSTQITVKQCELAFGDTVKVVGESDLFGSWDSDKGLDLEWQDGHDWVAKLEVPPGDCIFKVGFKPSEALDFIPMLFCWPMNFPF